MKLRMKITPGDATSPPWFATAMQTLATPEKQVASLNRQAKRAGLDVIYELATEAEYQAYKSRRCGPLL